MFLFLIISNTYTYTYKYTYKYLHIYISALWNCLAFDLQILPQVPVTDLGTMHSHGPGHADWFRMPVFEAPHPTRGYHGGARGEQTVHQACMAAKKGGPLLHAGGQCVLALSTKPYEIV